jgi:small ligand-binding sensory domain FIST
VAGILCSCNGRGEGLFGQPHHDAAAISRKLGTLPLAGLLCAGEIGPVAGRCAVHGFTASLALIVPSA